MSQNNKPISNIDGDIGDEAQSQINYNILLLYPLDCNYPRIISFPLENSLPCPNDVGIGPSETRSELEADHTT